MDRRTFISGMTVSFLAAPLAAAAQPAGKVFRVGYLSTAGSVFEPFRQGLRELGYVEGQNLMLETRLAHGRLDRLSALAAELVRTRPDVIAAVSSPAIRATRQATTTIPIVMAFSGVDPVKAGFVASLNRPGGNVTGITMLAPELSAKRLDVLKQALPGTKRVGVLAYQSNPGTAEQLKAVESAAMRAGVTVHPVYVQQPDRYDELFASLGQKRIDAILVLSDTVLSNDRTEIVQSAMRHRPPRFP